MVGWDKINGWGNINQKIPVLEYQICFVLEPLCPEGETPN